jgi:hypothetical protein
LASLAPAHTSRDCLCPLSDDQDRHTHHIEKYEGILPDNKKDFTQGFSGFTPEFSRRELVSGGFLRNNIICWPVNIKSHVSKGGDEVLMMI